MSQNHRLCHILVIAPERSASLALVAQYPLGELERQNALKMRICTAKEACASDLIWCDILFAVRPANAAMAAFVAEAKRMQRIVMCHWDDDLLSIPKESSSYAYFARPGVRNLTLATLLQADVVLSSSTLLGHHLSNLLERHAKAHIPVVVLPVPALQINVENIEVATSNAVNTPLTIGYGGSADQTDILQALLVPAFEKLWEQGRAINLQLVGPRVTVNARWQKFVSALAPTADYAAWLALRNKLQWHAALAPLSDGHFYRCKFYNKYLEFAAAGIPCLYSNVEPFKQVIVNGQNGLLVANTVDAWTNAITQITDKSVAQRIAANGLKDISENNNLGKVASEIKVLLAPWLGYRAPPARVTRNVKLSAKYKWVKANVVRRFL